jgi:tripartite-type tricarboxylate transporter receptor subunit TctC
MKTRLLSFIFVLFFVFGFSPVGFTADYPKKSIRVIIPYAAGGGTDVLARALQKPLEKELGTKIVVDNIPAGSTKVGTMEGMKAKADGYTLLLMSDRAWPVFYYAKTYDTKVWEQLSPVANLTVEPMAFVEVKANSPFKTWGDLVKAAKENPGKLSGGIAGGTTTLMINEIAQNAGIKINIVPFGGAGPSKIAVLGGHVDFRVCQVTEAISMIRAGETRGLAVSTDKRLNILPDVPTFKELGIGEGIIMTRSIWGPPNMPKDIVDTITKAIQKASRDPEYVKLIEDQLTYKVEYRPPAELSASLIDFDKKYGKMMAELFK